jgi:glyoxylase-like metal-dependent hydrolase (beta-lactamase superfamily II)
LENLRARGVDPESIDYVMCTHLHPDHVGWNTRLHNGRWVPTFPRAQYLIAHAEYQHRRAAYDADPGAYANAFADSILPIIESQQALLVDSDFALDQYLHVEAAPGHTPGNVIIHLQDRAASAVLSGDVIHHPIQVVYPEHSAVFCEDRAASARYRQAFVERYADQDTWILPAHFPYPTAGRIARHGARWRFKFADESPSSG